MSYKMFAWCKSRLVKCIVCKQNLKHYSALSFNANEYASVISVDSDLPGKKWICKPCRSSLLGEIRCVACDMEHPKHKTIRLRKNKYDMTDDLEYTILHDVSDGIGNICIEYDHHLHTTYVCTCCHSKFISYQVHVFCTSNYDLGEYIVSWALAAMNRIKGGSIEYICKTCHQNLASESGHIPKIPRNAAAHNRVNPGVMQCTNINLNFIL